MGQPGPRLTSPPGADGPAVLATFPRRRSSLVLRLMGEALGAGWTAAHPASALAVVEFEPFSAAAVERFEAALIRGEAEDSPAGFARFASEDFGSFLAFRSRWVERPDEGPRLVIDLGQFRADPGPAIAAALALLDPPRAADPAALAAVAGRVRDLLRREPGPDPARFRHHDATLFALLDRLVLRRRTVQEVFHRFMGRPIAERGILEMQAVPGLDELKRRLKATPEYLRRNGPAPHVPLAAAEPGMLSDPAFRMAHRAAKARLGWPLAQVFVSRPARLIYCPIGKVACTYLKRQMVRISDPPHADLILQAVHEQTDSLITGLQLSDYPAEEAMAMAGSPDYLRFAVLRDPADRLLSAYIEKFVVNRDTPANHVHTCAIVAAVQEGLGFEAPDFHRGITFRDFVSAVCSTPPDRLDPHWRPQADYLRGLDYDRLFPLSALDEVVDLMEARSGRTLPRRVENGTGSGTGSLHPGAADLLPGALDLLPTLHRDSFLEPDLDAAIRAYYAEDLELFLGAGAAAGSGGVAGAGGGAAAAAGTTPNSVRKVWTGRA